MHLMELFDQNDVPFSRYEADDDNSVVKKKDTRKTRLTLRQIHLLRQMNDIHTFEKAQEIEDVQKIYKAPTEEQPIG